MRPPALLATLLLVIPLLAGCLGDDPVLHLAFTQPDDAVEPAKQPARLAAAIEAATGRATRLYFVDNTEVALQAVASGRADAAFVDGAAGWLAWQRFGLDAVAAHLEADGRSYYIASAYVRADSPYQSMEDLRGARSCHTGLLKSAGTFMPLGWMMREGLVQRVGPDEVTSIEPTLRAFFGHINMPGSDAEVYGNYAGALRCLSDDVGDVSFGKDTTPATFCGGAQPRDWCLPLSEYRELQPFGRVPSHPVMVGPGTSAQKRADLVAGLLALSQTDDGRAILQEVLGARGIVAVSTEEHLGEYAANIQHVPGMTRYVEERLQR